VAVEHTRGVLILGQIPNIYEYIIYLCVGILVAYSGFYWFQKTRKGFADVL
jgi:lipopolysaccharide transport system permease protein